VSDAVLIAIIGAMQALGVAVVYAMQRGQRKRTEAIRYEITNDHEQPLREDMDEKHGAIVRLIQSLSASLRSVVRDVGGIREDIRQLRKDLSHTDERVDELERTRPHPNRTGET
jgi:5-bromo-4-chloroindolyl phosphate hydrolysis protein